MNVSRYGVVANNNPYEIELIVARTVCDGIEIDTDVVTVEWLPGQPQPKTVPAAQWTHTHIRNGIPKPAETTVYRILS